MVRRRAEWKPKGQRRARADAAAELKVTPYEPSRCRQHPSRVAGVHAGNPMVAMCDDCFLKANPPQVAGPGPSTTSDYTKIVERAEKARRRMKNDDTMEEGEAT